MLLDIPLKNEIRIKASANKREDGVLHNYAGMVTFWIDPDTGNIKYKNQSVRAGRVLRRVLETTEGKQLDDNTVKELSEYIKECIDRYELRFATDRKEWRRIYENGPRSCMSNCLVRTHNGMVHAVEAYSTPDFKLAYLIDKNNNNKIVARSVCSTINNSFSVIYGLKNVLESQLRNEGMEFNADLDNHKLLRIDVNENSIYDDNYIAPYVDHNYNAIKDGKYLIIGSGDLNIQNTEGVTAYLDTCECCGWQGHPDDFMVINDQWLCESCASDYVIDSEDEYEETYIHIDDAIRIMDTRGVTHFFDSGSSIIEQCQETDEWICTDSDICSCNFFHGEVITRYGDYEEAFYTMEAFDRHFGSIVIMDGDSVMDENGYFHTGARDTAMKNGQIYEDSEHGLVWQLDHHYWKSDSEECEYKMNKENRIKLLERVNYGTQYPDNSTSIIVFHHHPIA